MLKITEELRDNLIAYLSTKPYKEVAQGISELSRLEKIVEQPKTPDIPEDKK
jgi:hypothetical protein